MASMPRQFSIYTLLGGLVLIPLLLAALLLLAFGYRSAAEGMNREIHNSFDQNHSLLQTLLAGELALRRLQLKALARLPALRQAAAQSPAQVEKVVQNLDHSDEISDFDILVLVDSRGARCQNFSLPLNNLPSQCVAFQDEPSWNGWKLVVFENPDPKQRSQVGFVAQFPLIDTDTGLVTASLYGGVVLNENFSLMSKAMGVAPLQTRAIGLGYEGHLLVSSAKPESVEWRALHAALGAGTNVLRKGGNLLAIGHPVDLDPQGRLFFYSVADGSGFVALKNGFVLQIALALLICVLLAAGISLGAMQLALSPLQRLLEFAHKAREGGGENLQRGRVQEFNELSEELAKIVSELHRSQERLELYSREIEDAKTQTDRVNRNLAERGRQLEKSHQALSEAMQENRKLLHRLLHLQEKERRHLAQELHDDLGQALAVVSADAYLIQSQMSEGAPYRQSVVSIYERAQEMYDIVYNRIKQLRPMPLDDLGLLDAIRYMPTVDNLNQHGVALSIDLPEQLDPLPENLQISIYRIIQEGLTNILKHANASRALLRLEVVGDRRLELLIQDNGQGMPPRGQRHGYGLSGIEERVEALNGCFELDSAPKGGLMLRVSLPLGKPISPQPAPLADRLHDGS